MSLFYRYLILGFLVTAPTVAQAYNVLVLQSYPRSYVWANFIGHHILNGFNGQASQDFKIYVEHLDANTVFARYLQPSAPVISKQVLREFLDTYAGFDIDLVITVDQPAYDLMREKRHELFGNIPLLYCGVEKPKPYMENAAGILEGTNVEGNIDLIRAMEPNLEKLYLIGQEFWPRVAETGLVRVRDHLKKIGWNVELVDLVSKGMSFGDQVKALPEYAWALALASGKYFPGINKIPEAFISQLSAKKKLRIVTHWKLFFAANESIGGVTINGKVHGETIAHWAVEILRGKPITSFPREAHIFSRDLVYDQLVQAELDPSKAPDSFNIVGAPKPYWQTHWQEAIAVTGIFLALIAIIFSLLRSNAHRKKTSLEYKKARDEAERMSRLKSVFVGIVSHELRTPLTALLGFTEILRSKISGSDSKELLDRMQRSGNQLRGLIENSLDISKIESEQLDVRKEPVNIRSVVDDAKLIVSAQAEEAETIVMTKVDSDCPTQMLSDAIRVGQILVNLLTNAIKHSRSKSVSLLVDHEQRAPGRSMIRFIVRDQGDGIPPEDQERIFDLFTQTDRDLSKQNVGSGVGLFLSKRLAHLLGGTLVLRKSEVDKGSDFCLSVPFHEVPQEKSVTQEQTCRAKGERKLTNANVLVVDDSEDNLILVKHFLEAEGAKVHTAASGRQGIKLVNQIKPDLVLMDVQMPGIDGISATKELRRQGFRKPIIALTAHANPSELAGHMEFDSYQIKPISRERLISTLAEFAH